MGATALDAYARNDLKALRWAMECISIHPYLIAEAMKAFEGEDHRTTIEGMFACYRH